MYQTLLGLIPRRDYHSLTSTHNLKMSADTVSKDATFKAAAVARVAAISGPAVAITDARKNRTSRWEDTGNAPSVGIPILPTLTIFTLSVPAEAVRVDNTHANYSIVPYSPTEPGGSPPSFSTPPPAHSSHSEGTVSAPRAPSPPRENTYSLMTPIETAAGRSSHSTGRIPRRDSLKKYTDATMPAIYDALPYSSLQHMDLDLVDEWDNCPGGKLLAHPFDDEACNRDLHGVMHKIFTAAIEITKSPRVEVSPPRPSRAAIEAGCTPTCFLIYNLTEDESKLLLERSVWSSRNITFHVTSFYPACPDFLFSIKGFATGHTDSVHQIVHSVWHDDATGSFLDSIIEDFPQGERASANQAISRFIASMWVTLLPVKKSGNILAPRFNVYATGSLVLRQAVWTRLRDYLAGRVYASLMLGNGTTEITPYHCGVCRSIDHPMGLCPFPKIKGWNGPRKGRIVENSKAARGRQPRGSAYGGAHR